MNKNCGIEYRNSDLVLPFYYLLKQDAYIQAGTLQLKR